MIYICPIDVQLKKRPLRLFGVSFGGSFFGTRSRIEILNFSGLRISALASVLALLTQFCLIAFPQGPAIPPADQNDEFTPFRIGVAGEVLADVRKEDAIAAYTEYATAFARQQGVKANIGAKLFDELGALRNAVQRNELEIVGLVTEDYFKLKNDETLDLMFSGEVNNTSRMEYVLLVRSDSNIRELKDLKNKRIIEWIGAKMSLARTWLDVALMEKGLSSTDEFFGTIESSGKLFKVVLPVFFQQADVCLVTKQGYDTMEELNPQLGRDLRILAYSDGVVPFVTCFRSSFKGRIREETISAHVTAHDHPEGQQVLMLFRIDRIVHCQPSDLDSARHLVNRHRELSEKKRTRPGTESDEHL